MQVLYLYGFASGPLSTKAQFFKQKFSLTTINYQIIDYIPNSNAFTQMKPSLLLKLVSDYIENHHFHGEELILFGSSFGGLIASWYTYINPENVSKLILIAPAFKFTPIFISRTLGTSINEWKEKGIIYVDHYRYNRRTPLDYSLVKDLQSFPPPDFFLDLSQFPHIFSMVKKMRLFQ